MNLLFWLLWLLNAAFAILIMWAASYRSGYGAGVDLDTILLIGVAIVLVAGLIVRYGMKKPGVSLIVVGLPVLGLLLWYLWEKMQK